jgi:hypothetical protein
LYREELVDGLQQARVIARSNRVPFLVVQCEVQRTLLLIHRPGGRVRLLTREIHDDAIRDGDLRFFVGNRGPPVRIVYCLCDLFEQIKMLLGSGFLLVADTARRSSAI